MENDSRFSDSHDGHSGRISLSRISYHGWPDSLLLSNGIVEVIIVPAIGRVMQLRFAGDEAGALWENGELLGQPLSAKATADGWLNFGGDKAWPSPQSDWEKRTGRAWPPPATFDSVPLQATSEDSGVVLTSGVDPHFGIKVVRHVRLAPQSSQLKITTEFQKVAGATVRIGVWIVTQVPEPERVFILLPERSGFPGGFIQQTGPPPKDLRHDGRLLSLNRDPSEYIKIGTEGTSLLWMDKRLALLVRAEDTPGEYPNGGSRTEVYTNPDPYPYAELETEGPLVTLEAGARTARTNTYTLFRRNTSDCLLEARCLFALDGTSPRS